MTAKGVDPNLEDKKEAVKSVTLADALDGYLESRSNLKKRTKEDYRYYIDKYAPDWKAIALTDITKEMVASRHARIAQNNGAYAVRIILAWFLLTSMYIYKKKKLY